MGMIKQFLDLRYVKVPNLKWKQTTPKRVNSTGDTKYVQRAGHTHVIINHVPRVGP